MQLSNWHVMAEKKSNSSGHQYFYNHSRHQYFYGDLTDFDEDELSGMIEVAQNEWTSDDIVEIVGNLLEDVNHHSECQNPRIILDTMRNVDIEETKIVAFMRQYMDKMFDKYGN